MTTLEIKSVSQSFGTKQVLQDVSLTVQSDEIVSLLGQSGIGKTTLFNIIAGIKAPVHGEILLDHQAITGTTGNFSYMLQKDLLLPYRTIMQNVILPDLIKKVPKADAIKRATPLFKTFGITGTENLYPNELSGGMRQRAALLRTHLTDQKVTLLDEPFSALDELTKRDIYNWYLNLSKQMHSATLLITHSVDEALLLSDRIYILNGHPGQITKEITLHRQTDSLLDFELSKEFTDNKRIILEALKTL